MSALDKQEDVADGNNDDESNEVPATMSCFSYTDGSDPTTENDYDQFNSNNPKAVEQSISTVKVTDEISKLSSSQKSNNDIAEEVTHDETDKLGAGDLKLLSNAPTSSVMNISEKNPVEVDITTKYTLQDANVQSPISACNESPKTIGYKETVIDNVSDSDLELRWTDDEDEIELNTRPLSDEELNQQDKDIITDTNKVTEKTYENVQKDIDQDVAKIETKPEVIENPIEPNEGLMTVSATSDVQSLNDDSMKHLGKELETAAEVINKTIAEAHKLIGQDDPTALISKAIKEQTKSVEVDSSSVDVELNSTNNDPMDVDVPSIKSKSIVKQKSNTIEEQIKSVAGNSRSNNSKINSENIHAMDVDVSSVESESTVAESNITSDKIDSDGQSMDDVAMKQLVKILDVVDEDDKISEIDIDETIVDLKHLIDQDEDTIKQLGLDVKKSDDNSFLNPLRKSLQDNGTDKCKSKISEKETKSVDADSSEKDKEPMDVDIPSEIESTAVNSNLNKDDNQDITKQTTVLKNEKNTKSFTVTDDNNPKIDKNDDIKIEPHDRTDNDEFITPDLTDDSLKINTDHRINRPDVMLDIPSQEFDIDEDFDESSETIDQGQSRVKKDDNNMTAKSVTRIINKLIKDLDAEKSDEISVGKESNVHILDGSILQSSTEITVSGRKDDLEISKEGSKESCSKTLKEKADMSCEENNATSRANKSNDHIVNKNDNKDDVLTVSSDGFATGSCDVNDKISKIKDETNVAENMSVTSLEHTNETNDSVRINTDHRINRPDVMLDIPSQEFNIDEDFDESSETVKQGPSRVESDDINMTAKTVNSVSIDTTKATDADIITAESKSNSKTTTDNSQENQSEKTLIGETTVKLGKVLENETKTDENTPSIPQKDEEKTSEKDLKTVEPTESVENPDAIQPSTSEVTKMTPDDVEEEQEVTDRLGLLAETSRVIDDDDEQEPDDDEGEDDEDDDFDPDDEENSNLTGEHSEESNPPHSELDIQEEGIFGNRADVIGSVSDSNDADNKFDALMEDSKDNITIVENETMMIGTTDGIDDVITIKQEKDKKDIVKIEKESRTSDDAEKSTKERRKSILSDLLTKADDASQLAVDTTIPPDKLKTLELYKPKNKNVVNIVDLEESSSEDDAVSKQMTSPVVAAASLDQATETSTGETTQTGAKDKTEKDDKVGEIFNLDSDEDDKISEMNQDPSITGISRKDNQCVNHNCASDETVPYYLADRVTIAYYGAARWRRRAVCQNCLEVVNARNEGLVTGIKDLRPLMSLRMARPTQQLLEISDSDSEGEDEPVGESGAKVLEDQLTDLINDAWVKYKMDDRLKETENYLEKELDVMQKQSQEIDQLLKDCQKATDQLRLEFYSGFEPQRKELPAISMHDTPIASYSCLESDEDFNEASQLPMRYPKRRSTGAGEPPAKKQAIPLGYIDSDSKKVTRSKSEATDQNKADEDKDISVVRLSAEAAPADLPPPGELVKPPLRVGAQVYAMKNQYGAWLKGRVLEILPKVEHQYTQCRIRFEHKVKNSIKLLTGRSIAYTEPSEVRMTIGTRVIALFVNSDTNNKRDPYYYSGVIAEIPNPVNSYRYLVFFDDGYAQYVQHRHTRLVCESSALVWEEVHPFSRDFVCNYLMKYPERAMVRMHPGQGLTVEWNGKWWDTKVLQVDAALVCVSFPDGRAEWLYRGSTRLQPLFAELQAARRGDRARLPRSTKASTKTNMPYVEYTRTDDQTKSDGQSPEELRRQRVVAKKSTALSPYVPNATGEKDSVVSRVVYYTPKNSIRPYKLVPHTCGPQCKRTDVLSLEDLRSYNPLTRPLLSGWERQIVRHKLSREIMYRAPCGRRLRSMPELHRYLRALRSDMSVDLFDFSPNTHCLAEFVLNKSNVQKKDLSHGKENVPVPCVNYYDHSLPDFCLYNTERVPKAGVPLNLDPEFLCGCDCEDDCFDKTKCACWKMTLEGAKTIGIEGPHVGYEYRRLLEPLPSGIYECNSRCKCQSTCLNRVVQNPLQLKLQVFKTLRRGWGIRALSDVPKGAFLCIYAGNLLNDDTANLEGLNEGDEYLAELDYIEVVEAMKEGYEEDVPEAIKKIDKKELMKSDTEPESDTTESEEDTTQDKTDKNDDDFQPGYMALGLQEFNKRLRRRDKNKKNKEGKEDKEREQTKQEKEQIDEKPQMKKEEEEDCITISDDEEVRDSQREPARFAAQENMTDKKVVPKYRSIRSYFGKDEACYIMDAKVQGNIGRYLNHSCSPNVFVQNVFVDTHDPRFPWVSFFALHQIKAGTELTWNYNYDVGSVPGKVLYCFCEAPNCRGRLL